MLSIMILTRNRREKIITALQSCLACTLPEEVEFVIVDNASEDGTEEEVDHFFQVHPVKYQYYRMEENVGAAAGRNVGYQKAQGRYVYFLDDDAFIDGPKERFFSKMIAFLEANPDIFCITTGIYDTALQGDRWVMASKSNYAGAYKKALMFHGGSFLIDKRRYPGADDLFLGNQFFAMEEFYPSLKSYFDNRFIVAMNDLRVIHDPGASQAGKNTARILLGYVHALDAKMIFYPRLADPLLYVMFSLRIVKHLGCAALPEAYRRLAHQNKASSKETVSLAQFIKLTREFGVRIVF